MSLRLPYTLNNKVLQNNINVITQEYSQLIKNMGDIV